jgi:hypothetical protein
MKCAPEQKQLRADKLAAINRRQAQAALKRIEKRKAKMERRRADRCKRIVTDMMAPLKGEDAAFVQMAPPIANDTYVELGNEDVPPATEIPLSTVDRYMELERKLQSVPENQQWEEEDGWNEEIGALWTAMTPEEQAEVRLRSVAARMEPWTTAEPLTKEQLMRAEVKP